MVTKEELIRLKDLLLFSLQGWKYFYFQKQKNRNNQAKYEELNDMLMRVENFMIEVTNGIIQPNEFHSLLNVESEKDATIIINKLINIVNNSKLLNNPSLMKKEQYDEIISMYINDSKIFKIENIDGMALTVLSAGAIELYKNKLEILSGPNLSFYTNDYRLDLQRNELKSEEKLKKEKQERIGKIYNNPHISLVDKKYLLMSLGYIFEQYNREIKRIKSIEQDPNMYDITEQDDIDREINYRSTHL